MGRSPKEKPEDFRERVVGRIKRGLLRADMIKEIGCSQLKFAEWFMKDFPNLRVTGLKKAYNIQSSPAMQRPGNGNKGTKGKYKKTSDTMDDEQRELAHQRVREAQQDYLPRLVVPVAYVRRGFKLCTDTEN